MSKNVKNFTDYDFSPDTFSEFLKINNLNLEDGIIAVVSEYKKLKVELNGKLDEKRVDLNGQKTYRKIF